MLGAPVLLPDPLDGDRPIELRPSLEIWLALEKAHGGSLGALFVDTKIARVSLAVQVDLIYRCARNAGSSLKWPDICERVWRLGLYRTTDIVLELFDDIFVQTPQGESSAPGGEGDGVPLADGGSA